jgi:mRNA-degrading endonuclease RelE of RelBE toxin-antitoxin system
MVIDSKQLKKIINPNLGVEALRHLPSRTQIAVYENEPNKAFVQELDGLGNVKKQKVFEGFLGFWKATAEFENRIKDLLGLQEVYGFEVGMIIQMNQDTKKYKKGDYVVILEVDSNGSAIRTQKVNNTELKRIKQSNRITPLRKTDGIDFLEINGKKSFDDFKVDEVYELKGDVDNVRFTNYKKLKANFTYDIKNDAIGGNAQIEYFGFETDKDGQSRLMAEVIFDDGAKGRLPLSAFYSKTSSQKAPTTKTPASSSKQKTDDNKNQKRIEKELKKRDFYIRFDEANGVIEWIAATVLPKNVSVQGIKIPNNKLLTDDFFVISDKGKKAERQIYMAKYGLIIYRADKRGSFDAFIKELNAFKDFDATSIQNINNTIKMAEESNIISPRYAGLENS